MGINVYRHITFFAIVALVSTILATPAQVAAQTGPPDVTGTYFTGGLSSLYDCSLESADLSEPIFAYVNVTSQDGSLIAGNFGGPNGENAYLTFTADLADDGTFSGQWTWLDGIVQMYLTNQVVTGRFQGDSIEIDLTASYGVQEVLVCQYRISLASEASVLTWQEPDPNASTGLPPPRALTIAPLEQAGAKATENVAATVRSAWDRTARLDSPRDGMPTGYNVYKSSSPNVETTPQNLFTSVPATTTTVPAPNGTSGSFFVVTATYDTGESGPSNEVSGGVEAATVNTVKVTTKIKATGTGFSSTVQVFVDGIPFTTAAKVKNGTKVTQKGTLVTGQTLAQYITHGKTVAISFRNENGGIATKVYTKP